MGKEILKRRFRNWKIEFDDSSIRKVIQHFKYSDAIDLYFDVATEKMDLLQIKELLTSRDKTCGVANLKRLMSKQWKDLSPGCR